MAARPRLSRTPADLLAESKTFGYEFSQLCESATHIRRGTYGGKGVTHNNTVQGFISAFRNIACFFFSHQTPDFPDLRKDDLGAIDYVVDWPTRCPAASKLLCDAKKAADRQFAHMTAERRDLNFLPDKEYLWPIDSIERELLDVLKVFLTAAPASLLDPSASAKMQLLISPASTTHSGATPPVHQAKTGAAGVVSAGLNLCAKTCPD